MNRTVTHTVHDLRYLPAPSLGHFILSNVESRDPTPPTTFVLPFDDEGGLWLVRNLEAHRGIEFPGGHVEPGETPVQAAVREVLEEVGCDITEPLPIGYMELVSMAERSSVPESYLAKYPFPLSHQQFYVARVLRAHPFTVNEECGMPVRVPAAEVMTHPLIANHQGHLALVKAALEALAPARTNVHQGSSLESFLREEGMFDEVDTAARARLAARLA